MSYLIIERNQWTGHTALCAIPSNEPQPVAVSVGELRDAVEARTGRSRVLALKSCAAHLRRTGRLYVAADDHRPGVVIESVNHPAIAANRS